jgi:hypothetical protein
MPGLPVAGLRGEAEPDNADLPRAEEPRGTVRANDQYSGIAASSLPTVETK